MLKNFINYEKQTYFYVNFEEKTYGVVVGKNDIGNEEDVIKELLDENKKRIKALKKEWRISENLEKINYIFGKEKDNKHFTQEELDCIELLNLDNSKLFEFYKFIWANRNNTEFLDKWIKQLAKEIRR